MARDGCPRTEGEGASDVWILQPDSLTPLTRAPSASAATVKHLTFLLTDIEQSARAWERFPELMPKILDRHDAIIEGLINDHGGRVLKTRGEGDSVFAVFSGPSEALACGLALQLGLTQEKWPNGIKLPLRVAIHSGDVHERFGDYFGETVNRCARLRNFAQGGAVVFSKAVFEQTRDRLPPLASVRYLGPHVLKGMGQLERIYRLDHPELKGPGSLQRQREATPRRHKLMDRIHDVPLFWKLTLPLMMLTILLTSVLGLPIVRSFERTALDEIEADLLRGHQEFQQYLTETQAYLAESAINLSAHKELIKVSGKGNAALASTAVENLMNERKQLDVVALTEPSGDVISGRLRDRSGSLKSFSSHLQLGGAYGSALAGESLWLLPAIEGDVWLVNLRTLGSGDKLPMAVLAGVLLRDFTDRASTVMGSRIELYEHNGISFTDPTRISPKSRSHSQMELEGGEATLFRTFALDGNPSGTVSISTKVGDRFSAMRAKQRETFVVLAAGLVSAAAVGLTMVRVLMAQVRPLLSTIEKLERGELQSRAPVMGKDELGQVAAAFNRMASRLGDSYLQLEDLYKTAKKQRDE